MCESNLTGFLFIDKPKGWTSHDVVNKVRKILHIRKVGHTGTLDPLATGVLPICVGRSATKLADTIQADRKQYKAIMRLGIETDTQDITGQINEKCGNVEIDKNELDDAIKSFIGEIEQVPPMYSAIKINGQKLYDLARQGKTIERKPRKITIYNLEYKILNEIDVELLIDCSKGTYIRTICHDIGQKLGCGAVMAELVRTKNGRITLDDCIKIEDVSPERLLSISDYNKKFCTK